MKNDITWEHSESSELDKQTQDSSQGDPSAFGAKPFLLPLSLDSSLGNLAGLQSKTFPLSSFLPPLSSFFRQLVRQPRRLAKQNHCSLLTALYSSKSSPSRNPGNPRTKTFSLLPS
jgi:hypothetical protein